VTLDGVWLWWQDVSLLDPLNWATIALVLFAFSTARHTRVYCTLTLPNKEEVTDIFLSVGTIYGVFNVIYVAWSGRPLSDAKSGIFYLLAALISIVVEKAAKLPLGVSIAPARSARRRKSGWAALSLPPPPPPPPAGVRDESVVGRGDPVG
jgi:hypothetical protein